MPYSANKVHELGLGECKGRDMMQIMGSVLHAVKVRPDIAYITSFFCQFNSSYDDNHLECAKRVISYLNHTKDYSLFIKASDLQVSG